MPEDKINPYDLAALQEAVNDSATRVSTIWITFLIFSLYLLVAVTTVTQRQLLLADPIKLPVLNIELPLWGFFFLAPVLFVILHAYVVLQVLLLGRTTAAYNIAIRRLDIGVEDDNTLRQRLANTLFAQIFAGSPREREGFIGALLKAMAWITLAVAPVVILLTFEFSFLAYHSSGVTWMHRFLILLEIVAFFVVWPLALHPERDFQQPQIGAVIKRLITMPWRCFSSNKRSADFLWLRDHAIPLAACLFYLIVPLWIASFPGEMHVNLLSGNPLTAVDCHYGWVTREFQIVNVHIDLRFDRLIVPYVEAVDSDKLAKITKATSEKHLPSYEGERTQDFQDRDLDCSDLSSADLRRVNLTHDLLIGARLQSAALDGASLDFADLEGAWLYGATLVNASLQHAFLFGTFLDKADLRSANLSSARLDGAIYLEKALLRGAKLIGASLHALGSPLWDDEIWGIDFENADLSGVHAEGVVWNDAEFGGATLTQAHFEGALLDGAHFKNANLTGAHFDGADLESYAEISDVDGAELSGASFKGATLKDMDFRKTDYKEADFEGAHTEGVQPQDLVPPPVPPAVPGPAPSILLPSVLATPPKASTTPSVMPQPKPPASNQK